MLNYFEIKRSFSFYSTFMSTEDIKHRPNILFAIADDWSFGHAGAYGCKWINTPAFDRLAKEGILLIVHTRQMQNVLPLEPSY